MTAAELERKLKRYTYLVVTATELRQQLAGLTYKTTSSLSLDAPAMTNAFHSKVEQYGEKEVELKLKIKSKEREIKEIQQLIEKSGLSDIEKGVLWCIANNDRLQSYARANIITTSYVYKIRDRAIKKVLEKGA